MDQSEIQERQEQLWSRFTANSQAYEGALRLKVAHTVFGEHESVSYPFVTDIPREASLLEYMIEDIPVRLCVRFIRKNICSSVGGRYFMAVAYTNDHNLPYDVGEETHKPPLWITIIDDVLHTKLCERLMREDPKQYEDTSRRRQWYY